METYRHRLLIGACGWEHSTWAGSFYPEDLPDDWQLTFYRNEFRLVLIPAPCWQEGDNGPRQWLDACDDDFTFLAEVPVELVRRALRDPGAHDALLAWRQARQGLGTQCLGTLVRVPDEAVSEGGLERTLALLADSPQLCLDVSTGAARHTAETLARRMKLGLVWDGESTEPRFGWGALAVTRLRRAPADLRGLRRVVEGACAPADPQRTAALVFDTNPPDIELMRQAEVIANLL
jgi:hypothetical protein